MAKMKLEEMPWKDVQALAKRLGIPFVGVRKADLLSAIAAHAKSGQAPEAASAQKVQAAQGSQAPVKAPPVKAERQARPARERKAPEAAEFDASDRSDLALLIVSAESLADVVASKVNPMNIFALKYRQLAGIARELCDLFDDRGHCGVPKEGE